MTGASYGAPCSRRRLAARIDRASICMVLEPGFGPVAGVGGPISSSVSGSRTAVFAIT